MSSTLSPSHLSHPRAWAILIGLSFIWGSSFVAIKLALETIGPLWIAAGRLTIAVILLGTYSAYVKIPMPQTKAQWVWCALMGLVGASVPFALLSWGSQFVPSAFAGIMMATVPFYVLVISLLLINGTRLTIGRVMGLSIGFFGAALVIMAGEGPFEAEIPILAISALITTAFGYALASVMAKLGPCMDVTTKSFGMMATAAPVSIITALIFEPVPLAQLDVMNAFAIAYLGIFPTAIATLLLFYIVKIRGPNFLAYSNYLTPVSAVFLGVALRDEIISQTQLTGLAFILIGIAVSERARSGAQQSD